jgi:choline kinase
VTTQAVILAAGLGSRLRPLTDVRPKAALALGGQPLVAHALESLAACGVTSAVVVAGHAREALLEALPHVPGLGVTVVDNPEYATTNTLASLVCAAPALDDGDFFLLDGDVMFERQVLSRLLGPGTRLAVDRGTPLDVDAVKVALVGDRVVAIGKALPDGVLGAAESIGLAKIAGALAPPLFAMGHALLAAGASQAYYEAAFERLIATEAAFDAADVTGLKWVEIDDHEDLARARARFAPAEASR